MKRFKLDSKERAALGRREQKRIVVTYLTESMEEPKTKRQVPAEFKKLRGIVNVTEEEMARDEHLAHIMER